MVYCKHVHNRAGTQLQRRIAKQIHADVAVRRCEQFKESAALSTGVYIDVHEQDKTQT